MLRPMAEMAPLLLGGAWEHEPERSRTMQRDKQNVQEEEPVGIVISRGNRDQQEPRFSAYVWGKAPAASSATKAA